MTDMAELDGTAQDVRAAGDRLRKLVKRRCTECGHLATEFDLKYSNLYTNCVHPAQTYGPPENCYPGEWERICPECGAKESFDE